MLSTETEFTKKQNAGSRASIITKIFSPMARLRDIFPNHIYIVAFHKICEKVLYFWFGEFSHQDFRAISRFYSHNDFCLFFEYIFQPI